MLNVKSSQYLTQSEMRAKARSIFATEGSSNTSEKYSHIPTYRIVEDMETLGWKPVDVKEVKARKNAGFQKHLIIFRNEDIMVKGQDGDNVFPQILLTNSSDGKNAFTFPSRNVSFSM